VADQDPIENLKFNYSQRTIQMKLTNRAMAKAAMLRPIESAPLVNDFFMLTMAPQFSSGHTNLTPKSYAGKSLYESSQSNVVDFVELYICYPQVS
jgi:hypothetical protein